MSRPIEAITEKDIQNIAAVERGDMTAQEYISDSERRMRGRERRGKRRRAERYCLDVYYVDGVTHYGYVPSKKLSGYQEFVRFHRYGGTHSRRHITDGRMNFERELNFHPFRASNRRYEAAYLTPRAKRIYDFPNKTLDIHDFFKETPKYVEAEE
jgi:hypothetical protein